MKNRRKAAEITITAVLLIIMCIFAQGVRVQDDSHVIKELVEETILKEAVRDDRPRASEIYDGRAYDEDISLPMDWSCAEIESRNTCWCMHSFVFLDTVYMEYEKTGAEEPGKVIRDYMIDWVEANPIALEGNEWAWHDDTTARRVYRMSYYYDLFRKDFTEEEQQLIEKSLKDQVSLLCSESFYKEKHNHGMFQDMAVLAYSLILMEDGEERMENVSLAFSRSKEYFEYVFTEDGVHKEHSPSYFKEVLVAVRFFERISQDISPEIHTFYERIIKNGQAYLLYIEKPDGTWPSLGDSSRANGYDEDLFAGNEEMKYVRTAGKEGIRPADEKVFAEGGYAVFRSSWDDEEDDATWMMFVASTFSSTHKHGDDLEVLLYHKGDLLVEGGNRDYNYNHEQTAWAYSAYAHNVMLVDGKPFPVTFSENGFQSIKPEALETGIIDYSIDTDVKSVTGIQKRYKGVEQKRTLEYAKNENIVTIQDYITTENSIKATLLYHIAEGIQVVENAAGWELYRGNEWIATVEPESEEILELETVTGTAGKYPYNTWIFEGDLKAREGSLLMIKMSCAGNSDTMVSTRIYLH